MTGAGRFGDGIQIVSCPHLRRRYRWLAHLFLCDVHHCLVAAFVSGLVLVNLPVCSALGFRRVADQW